MTQEQLYDLLNDMTVEEKIGQLVQLNGDFYSQEESVKTGPMQWLKITQEQIDAAGSILGTLGAEKVRKIQQRYMESQPHKIPMLFMADIICGFKTIFPIPLAQGCSFDPEVSKTGARVAAKEAAVSGLHVTFAPMIDLARNARWGRVMETTGEDTYLNSRFAQALVKGFQGGEGETIGKHSLGACFKHFAGYGAPEGGREYNNVELSERTLREDYLPAYEAAVKAGCSMGMTSFNTLNRIPSTGNKWLLRQILREEMGFDGALISDWASIQEMIAHRIARNEKEAAKLAIEAGTDIDMMTNCYVNHLAELLEEGSIDVALIDEAVLRVLTLKNKLGLFENPYKDANEIEEKEVVLCEEHRQASREAATKTMVLLKNENHLLPLKKEGQKIAFIGPYVDNKWVISSWSFLADKEDCVTIKEGVLKKCKEESIRFETGSYLLGNNAQLRGFGTEIDEQYEEDNANAMLKRAKEAAKWADVVVLALGEHSLQSGEASARTELLIPAVQQQLLNEIQSVNENLAVVLFNGRPLDLREVEPKAKAILEAWIPGTEAGNAIADLLFGDVIPNAKLSMSFPYCVGQTPVYYNQMPTGRPFDPEHNNDKERFRSRYIDAPNEPFYPFGYGLSYTSFEYSEVTLSPECISRSAALNGSSIIASVKVTNTGAFTGQEVVQLYLRDEYGSVSRPVRTLKGFEKIALAPGETKEVAFTITEDMLRFYDINMKLVSEPGDFTVYIGPDSTTKNGTRFVMEE